MADTLESTLTATLTEAGVELTLTVENVGSEPVELSFSDGQRVEFVAVDADDEEAWRWSDGRMFTMALGSETVEPSDQVAYDGTWEDPPAGEYDVSGSLTATDADAEASMTVVIPGE